MTHIDDLVAHEKLVNKVFLRLMLTGRYQSLNKHVKYGRHGNTGECDIIAMTSNCIHYYEIKGHCHPRSYDRALAQFKRFKATHPIVDTKFIYVSDTKVKRVYL